MDHKYKILSMSTVMPFIINFEDLNTPTQVKSIQVKVDYANEKVYFENENDELDYLQLQTDILNTLRPPDPEPNHTEVYEMINKKMAEMRSGNYGYNMRNMDVYE